MKLLTILLLFGIQFSGCTSSAPPAATTPETVSETDAPADTTKPYYDPEFKMPPKTSWVLQRINGQELSVADIRGEIPTLNLNLAEGKARGSGGCNNYNSSVKLEENTIRFGHIMSTKVNCPSIGIERRFFDILNFGMLTYQYKPGRLIIQRDIRSVLEFKEVKPRK